MKKLRGFSVILVCLTLMATGLVLAACKEPGPENSGGSGNNNNNNGNNNGNNGGNEGGNNGETTVTYTITFNANGGSGTAPGLQTVNAGSSMTLPNGNGLSKTGFAFGGWNTNDSGTGTAYQSGDSYTPTANTTFYAKWNVVSYTVTFNANGGSGTVSPMTADHGSSIIIPSGSGLTKSNHIFAGWNTNISGTGSDYNAGSSYTVNGDITFYAKWLEAGVPICTIRFETNGGSPVGNAIILQYAAVNRPTNPTRTGYRFVDWFANPELTEAYNFSSIVVVDIVLYAKWNPITYTVSYNKNAASATGTMTSSSHTYDVDKNLNPNAFVRTGYVFDGWARTTTGAVEFTDGESVKNLTATSSGTVYLYAQWLLNLAVTLDVKQIIEGAPIIANITISRTGSNGNPVTYNVSVNASDFDAGSIRWEVAGVGAYASQPVTGTGASFTLNAAEIKYNSLGGHSLILTVAKGGMDYQRAIPFTIVQ